MVNRKRNQVSEDEEDVDHSASDFEAKSKKATIPKATSEGGVRSRVRTTKKPKLADAVDEQLPAGGENVKVCKNAEGEKYVELGKKKRASIRSFKSQVFLDIREYYGEQGDEKPGKKGISLAVEQWEALKGSVDVIDSCFAELRKK